MTKHRYVADGKIKILHFSHYAPWGPRRIEQGKEVGGHSVCAFKITGEGMITYYLLEIEYDLAKSLKKDQSALAQFVLEPENLRNATVLDSIKVAV